jgi:glycosyltransferase involved in cell wall biosynthesis
MLLALIILIIGALIELLVVGLTGKIRILGCSIAAGLLIAGTILLLRRPNIANIIVSIAVLYKLFNLARVAHGRMAAPYILRMARRTSVTLSITAIVVLITWVLLASMYPNNHFYIVLVGIMQTALLIYALIVIKLRTKSKIIAEASSQKLPSVTIAIPARNETDDLEACLRSFIASDYEKLEIIALDDCSQTTRTPELIRQFAQDGVRFIPGDKVRPNWLAKNQAYATLADAASGEIILFCGVDIRVRPDSVRNLVTEMQRTKSTMLTVMPRNILDGGKISMPQVMRYAREFISSGLGSKNPVTFSTCWLITKKALKKSGGFSAVSHKVLPETFFAQQALSKNTYEFTSQSWGVETNKKLQDQRETALRTLYPRLHRRPELVMVSSLLQLGTAVVPLLLMVYGLVTGAWLIAILGLINTTLLMQTFSSLVLAMYGSANNAQIMRFVPAILLDVYLLHQSMYCYEFSFVEWKGRNICVPVMHFEPRLKSLFKN